MAIESRSSRGIQDPHSLATILNNDETVQVLPYTQRRDLKPIYQHLHPSFYGHDLETLDFDTDAD